MTSLAESEIYGDSLTFSDGHFEIWDRLARMSAAQLERVGLPKLLLDRDYEGFPRGRVVYHTADRTFTIYADRRLQKAETVDAIRLAFGLARPTSIGAIR